MIFGMILELFSVSALNNLHPFLFLRYFLLDALLYVPYGFLYGARWVVCCVARIGHLTMSSKLQLDVGPDRSFDCAIRAFRLDQLDVIYTGPDRSFDSAIRASGFDQLDVIYTGSDRSFDYAIRAFGPARCYLCWAGLVIGLRHPGFLTARCYLC